MKEVSNDLSFQGRVSVQSSPTGLVVQFQGRTDAHDLGHALAAIITTYINVVCERNADCDPDELLKTVIDGIHCGMENNPDLLVYH